MPVQKLHRCKAAIAPAASMRGHKATAATIPKIKISATELRRDSAAEARLKAAESNC
jgi:hypothetical protein